MKLKRFLSLALAFMMVLSICPMQVFAAEEEAPALPTATVTKLKRDDLTFALNFKADEVTEEQLDYYDDWYADYELTVNKDVTFNANGGADGYLSGQYDAWGSEWVDVPDVNVTLNANEPLKIMEYAAELMGQSGLKLTYNDVYNFVKDFDCGVYFTDEFIAENPDIKVTLQLKMYNPADESEDYVIGTYVFTLGVPTATVTKLKIDDLTFALNFKADEVTEEQLDYYGDWYADYELTVNKDVTFNANGGADGYLSGQYDAWGSEWVDVPDVNVTLNANKPLKIMEYAAELMGQSGLKLTYNDVYTFVKDFDCGVYFTDEFLAENYDIEVTLQLKMYNPADESKSHVIGTYVFTLGVVAVNVETGKLYNDVNLATSEAEEGQTVKLLRNVNAGKQFTVFDDVTFDLNGKKLTAEHVASFGDIVDNSAENSGLLVVEARKAHIRIDNDQAPVKTADGYCFIEIEGFNQAFYKGKYVFQPIFEPFAHELLKNGKASTEVDVCIRVTWENAKGEERSQLFRYNDEMLVRYLNSLNTSKELMFTIALNFTEQPKGLRYQAYVDSGLGVETFSEEPIPHPTETTVQTENTTINAEADKASALVAEGTKLSGTELSLKITELDESNANVTVSDGESLKSVDVHIDGIANSNTVPAIITVKELAEAGLNQGNLKLYHVENGTANEMTQVFSLDEVDAHNEFYYDPATGDVTMALATFSEVAVVAEDDAAWKGNFDYSWYTNAVAPIDGESAAEYTIANADQLAAFGAIVGGMAEGIEQDSFSGKTVKLIADINLGDKEAKNNPDLIFYPIGYNSSDGKYEKTGVAVSTGFYNFCGTFDGNGHTISNFYQNTWEMKGDNNYYDATLQYYRDGMGLFGRVYGGTVKNLTVNNFSSDGEYTTTGVIAAYADGANFENIAITECNPRVYNIGNGGIVGCVGWYAKEANLKTTFKNITVDNSNKISALWGSYDVACGGIVGQYYPTSGQSSASYPVNGGVHFENCHISAQMDVYNDVCANYQYYAYRYTGMLIGSVRENVTTDGHSYPKMDGITAEKSTVHFGTWNDYYYCEIIDNTTASYTHDYQMSRLTEIKAIDGTNITYLDGTTGTVPTSGRANYVIVDYSKGHATENATCHHFKDGAVWTHDMGGIQTGVDENGDGQDDLKEDKQHIYLEFNNLVTGYGWGVTSKGLTDFEGVKNMDITEGDQEESVVKFESKFNNKNFTYRIGNQNTVSVNSLFAAKEGATISNSGVVVSLETVSGNAFGTFTANTADWTKGTIQFRGTGVVKVTIQDYNFCIPTELYLEVVDAVNATGATSATNKNVVLLNDCDFSSLEVSGGYTLYGNGFTMTCGSDSAALDFGYSFVELDNGILDNVQIVCPNFDYAALYKSNLTSSDNRSETTDRTRYYNAKSGVMVSGNSQILNSRISGARAAVYVAGGNLLIDNSRIELGAVASLLIGSANGVTLRDVTLVQKPTPSTYDSSKTLIGFSVLFICDENGDAAPVTLEGTLVQNAWVDESDKQYVPSAGQSIISTVLGKTDYLHNLNGDGTNESLNLGFAYMPESLTSKVNTTTITDNRTNKNDVPYDYAEISILNGKTYVYTYKNTKGTADSFKTESEYKPNKYSDIIAVNYSDISDGLTTGKSFGTDGWVYELNVDLDKLSGYAFDFSKLSMSVNGVPVNDYKVNGSAKPTSTVAVTAGGVTYTLTATIDGKEYTATYKVTGTETSKESPSLVGTPSYEAGLCVASSYGGTWSGAAPALEGIQIKYWSVAEKQYKTIKLSDYTPTTKGQQNGTNTTWTYSPANGDFTLTLTGGQVHSSNNVYAMPVVCNGKLYFVASKSNGLVNSGNPARTIPVTYTFKDNNNGDVLTFSHTWSVAENKDAQYKYSDFCKGTLTKLEKGSGSNPCFTPDTLVTLADGTQKRIDELTFSDKILAWDFFEGKYVAKEIALLVDHGKGEYRVANLEFSDGNKLRIIEKHGVFDYDLNKFVDISVDNMSEYIGHRFVKYNANGGYDVVTLVKAYETVEITNSYCVNSAETFNAICSGMLTVAPPEDFYNWIEMDGKLHYDVEKFNEDVEKYGLYDYEVFKDYVTYEQFMDWNGAYLRIPVEKGIFSFEFIVELIKENKEFMPK